LRSGAAQFNYPGQSTDASGFFTVTAGPLADGLYTWWAKGPQYLAVTGTLTLAGAPATSVEMGLMSVGDVNNDNFVGLADFNIMDASYGRRYGDPGYDDRADFTGDRLVNVADFNLLKNNFGR